MVAEGYYAEKVSKKFRQDLEVHHRFRGASQI